MRARGPALGEAERDKSGAAGRELSLSAGGNDDVGEHAKWVSPEAAFSRAQMRFELKHAAGSDVANSPITVAALGRSTCGQSGAARRQRLSQHKGGVDGWMGGWWVVGGWVDGWVVGGGWMGGRVRV